MAFLPLVVTGAVLLLVLPWWPWSRGWGWAPAGMMGVVVVTAGLFVLAASGAGG